jgi:hypothetical protein
MIATSANEYRGSGAVDTAPAYHRGAG